MTTHLGLQRILLPSAQVSSLTTGSITLPSARGAYVEPVFGQYYSIASYTVPSDTGSEITFSSINQSYKHLVIVNQIGSTYGGSGGGDGGYFRVNNNSSSLYNTSYIVGNGASASSSSPGLTDRFDFGGLWAGNGNAYGTTIYTIYDYTNTNKFKTISIMAGNSLLAGTNGTNSQTQYAVGVFKSTTAISQLNFRISTAIGSDGNIRANSKFSIFGIGA